MGKHWSYYIFLVWLSYCMSVGLLIFTEGFLLNRVSRTETSQCSSSLELNDSSFHEIYQNPEKAGTVCLGPQARVVLLVVDALKHEFALWKTDTDNDGPTYHRNKLPIIHELLERHPGSSRLYKFIADPPTTTMQRLKALTTGTLPTFIDVGSNFATEEISEDNLIDQIAERGVVFMGDDTWTGLFPNRFLRQYPLPSFNVWDLDTVDNGVKSRVVPEMRTKDWSMLIAHVLGVDHCGHRYGPNHPEMARKLRDTDHLIRAIVDNLDQDMMLFVVGDHGMTTTGDHGGDSRAEVEAAMFVYSKMPLFNGVLADVDEVQQIDLVPTLASILGVSVPFSNIGTVVLGSLPSSSGINAKFDGFQYALHSLWSNVVQAKRYLERYSSDTYLFPVEKLDALEARYHVLFGQIDAVRDVETFESFATEAKAYLKRIRDMCEEVWVQFDLTLMSEGLVLMLSVIILSYLVIDGIPRPLVIHIFGTMFLMRFLMTMIGAALIATVLFHFGIIEQLYAPVFFITGMVSVATQAVPVIRNSRWGNGKRRNRKWSTRCAWVVLFASLYSLFSNSYVVEEGTVLAFLIVTLIWFMVWDGGFENTGLSELKLRTSRAILIALGVLGSVSVRFSSYFWRCREEQERFCGLSKSSEPRSRLLNSLNDMIVLSTLGVLALYVMVVGRWLRCCGVTGGFLPGESVVRYSPGIILGCTGGFWILQRLPKDAKVKLFLPWKADVFPVIVYFLTLLGLFSLYRRPLGGDPEHVKIDPSGHVVSRPSEKRRKEDPVVRTTQENRDPCVIYSATFALLSVFLTLLVALLLGDALAPSAVLMGIVCSSILGISAVERFRHAVTFVDLLEVPTPSLLCWFIAAESYFYGTGHQAAFPTIHWEAAFVGTGGHFYTNAIPATLIGINTFGSHIILGATLPLMVVAPFTLLLVFPSLANVNVLLSTDLKRGELLLYERNAEMLGATVAISGRYMLLHGIRAFGCMVAATVHSRHLMVWKIFAPKLIFEGLGLMVTLGSVLISFLLVIRINRQIERVVTRRTKSR